MKAKLLLLLLLACVGVMHGQEKMFSPKEIAIKYIESIDSTFIKYKNSVDTLFVNYNEKRNFVIHPKALRKNLSTVYQSIIPNNQSLNDNTSSFSYTQSDENQKIAIATAYQFGSLDNHFLNVGVSAEGKNGIFNLYSDKSWSNNTSLSIGYSKVIKASQFYSDSTIIEKRLIEKRKIFKDSLSARIQYNALLDQADLKKKLEAEQVKLDEFQRLYLKSEDVTDLKIIEELALIDKKIKEYSKRIEEYAYLERQFLKNNIEDDVADKFVGFDTKNDIMYGYNVFWFQVNSKLMNNTYTFKEETNKDNTANRNVFHVNISSSIMWNMLGNRTMQYATFGVSTFRGSYLSNPAFKNMTPVFNGDNVMSDGELLGTLDDLKKPVWQYAFNAYYANFFMFKRHLGFSLNAQYNNAFENDIAKNYKENYTVAFGPIFKIQGEDEWNKATFGISAGYENLPSKAVAKDYFILKAYVGVPFNVFQKKSKK